ncbi:brevican core protein-like [Branchiostoma lanceolatum]|uniref:brevican core protein-like n=1 Tax=Branchiostoma lanceolatum TaxID=7740 RepID=UPI003452362E
MAGAGWVTTLCFTLTVLSSYETLQEESSLLVDGTAEIIVSDGGFVFNHIRWRDIAGRIPNRPDWSRVHHLQKVDSHLEHVLRKGQKQLERTKKIVSRARGRCFANPCHAKATCTDDPNPAIHANCTCKTGYPGDGLVNGTGCSECLTGYSVDAFKFGNKCYKFPNLQASFKLARTICQRESGRLAIAKDAAINNFIAKKARGISSGHNYRTVFIGLTDIDEEGKFIWEDGTQLSARDYRNWLMGWPDNWRKEPQSDEDCAIINSLNHMWTDVRCELQHGFVCETTGNNRHISIHL